MISSIMLVSRRLLRKVQRTCWSRPRTRTTISRRRKSTLRSWTMKSLEFVLTIWTPSSKMTFWSGNWTSWSRKELPKRRRSKSRNVWRRKIRSRSPRSSCRSISWTESWLSWGKTVMMIRIVDHLRISWAISRSRPKSSKLSSSTSKNNGSLTRPNSSTNKQKKWRSQLSVPRWWPNLLS